MIATLPTVFLGPSVAERRREEVVPQAKPAMAAKRAVLVGSTDSHVRSLLADVLRDINIEIELGGVETSSADAVLAMVERVEGIQVIPEARSRFGRAPIVAILPLGTHRLATRAIAAGAQACYLLDMPIDRLRGLLLALLKDAPADDKRRTQPGVKAVGKKR